MYFLNKKPLALPPWFTPKVSVIKHQTITLTDVGLLLIVPMLTHFIKNCSKIQQFSCTNCTWKLFYCDTTDIKEFQNVVCKWPPFCLSHNLLLFMRNGLHSGDVRDIWDALYMPNKMVRFLIACQEFLLLWPFMQPTNHTPFQAAMLEIELSWKQFFMLIEIS